MFKCITLFVFALLILPNQLLAQKYAIKADLVHTMSGQAIEQGIVLVSDGKIERVGTQSRISVPDGYEILEAAVVTPGLIDARSVVGLNGIFNYEHDQDALDTSRPIQADLRAFDAYNPREALVDWIRRLGVTTVHTGHAPGALVSGQTMLIKTDGNNNLGESILDSTVTLAMTLGASVGRNFNSPGTRSKGVALLRSELYAAQEYKNRQNSDNPPARDLNKEALADVLRGETKALITANRATEIMTALRIAREFDIEIILDGAAEAFLLIDEIKEAGVPVFIHPTMVRTGGEMQSASFTTAGKLHAAGIPVFFQSGYEGYVPKTRVVLYEAAIAMVNGFGYDETLAALTIDAARFFGVDDRIGSLEAGKDADIVLFNGDPFEYTSNVCTVLINGRIVSDTCL